MTMAQTWSFKSELALEEFVYANLWQLMQLQPLARQYTIDNQVCDILAINSQKQLVVIELKNGKDRYVIPQLTRYYAALVQQQPFSEQVDYTQPIRLFAIAPSFHTHNLIDRDYSQLHFNCLQFQVIQDKHQTLLFRLMNLDQVLFSTIEIPPLFQNYLQREDQDFEVEIVRHIGLPPKSLRKLLEGLSPEEQQQWLMVREQILLFHEQMAEIGRSTTTQYGLRKGATDIYKTKLCAEIRPTAPGLPYPRLMLRLPYAKREFGAPGRTYKKERVLGLAWATVPLPYQWQERPQIFYYFSKSRIRYSFELSPSQLSMVYQQLTGESRQIQSTQDIIELALEQWSNNLSND